MSWLKWRRCKEESTPEAPSKEDGRKERLKAEQQLRETAEQWSAVDEVSGKLEEVRRRTGPDPFIDEMASAFRSHRTHHREA